MHRNIFAFTALEGTYPEYVSINQQDDGSFTVDVRGPKKPPDAEHAFEMPGDTIRVTIPREQLAVIVGNIADFALR